jgi:two-component system cell cycle sensor histidine kinase/response regulator CckA
MIERLVRRLSRYGIGAVPPGRRGSATAVVRSSAAMAFLAGLIALAWATLEPTSRAIPVLGIALACFALGGIYILFRRRPRLPIATLGIALAALGSIGIAVDYDDWTLGFLFYVLAAVHAAYFAWPPIVLAQFAVASAGFLPVSIDRGRGARALVDWLAVTFTLACLTLVVYLARRMLEGLVGDLQMRAREQQVVARLGQRALAQSDLGEVMQEAATLVAETTGLERVVIFEVLPGQGAFLTRACVGPLGDDRHGDLSLGSDSFTNYTLLAGEPVVVIDLASEARFTPTPLLLERGIVSAVNVVVPGREHAWGVLGVRTTKSRVFSDAEVDFLQAVANVLGSAIERREDESSLRSGRASLDELNERLSAIIDASPVAVMEIDPDRNVVVWNEAAERIFGWKSEDVIGRRLPVTPEEYEQESADLIGRVVAGDHIVGFETVRKRRDGTLIPVSLSLAPHHDGDGRLLGMIGVGIDLSEHKFAEEELSRSRELYRVVVENSHDMVAVLDPMGRFVFASPSYEQVLGYSPEELVDVSPISLVHPSDVQRASDALRQVVTDQGTSVVELRMRHKRGSWVFVEGTTTSVEDEQGQLQSILMSFRDISERRLAEEELREAEARYRLLVEQLPLVTYVNIPGQLGRWVYLSPQLEEILGFKPSDWTSDLDAFINALHPDDRERVIEERSASTGKGRIALEYRLISKSGRTVWVRDEAVVVRDLSGKPLYVQGYLLDISVEREAENERKRLEAQLLHSQKMEAIGRLAGGIAHDFNNLLTAIIGYSELIVSELDPSSSLARDAEEIKRAAEQAGAMTQQLLAFSRRQVLQPTLLTPNEIVAHMEKMLQRLIGEDIELVTDLNPEIASIRSDRGQIEQVIMNLVVNARDAMPHGGRLTIETANATLAPAEATGLGLSAGDFVVLTISDTGEGMDEETLSHVFEPFFTTKELGKGTGLGLATVHGIVEQSGGATSVSSVPGEGTVFRVYLPVAFAEVEGVETILPLAETRGSETLLLVEDEEMVRQLVGRVLRELGYEVLEASSSAEALEVSARLDRPIDLLVTDVVMPGMSGRELAEQLAQTRPETRVLFMSGYTEEAIVHHGVLGGESDFIGKPFTPQELAHKIRGVLAGELAESERSQPAAS